jgi:hypothetical protein
MNPQNVERPGKHNAHNANLFKMRGYELNAWPINTFQNLERIIHKGAISSGCTINEGKHVYLSKEVEDWFRSRYQPISGENFELNAVDLKDTVELMNEEVAKASKSLRENWIVPENICAFLKPQNQ